MTTASPHEKLKGTTDLVGKRRCGNPTTQSGTATSTDYAVRILITATTKGASHATERMAATRLQAGTKPPWAHFIGEKSTRKRNVSQELQECMVRLYIYTVSGRPVAHAKNVKMETLGTSQTLDPVPGTFQR